MLVYKTVCRSNIYIFTNTSMHHTLPTENLGVIFLALLVMTALGGKQTPRCPMKAQPTAELFDNSALSAAPPLSPRSLSTAETCGASSISLSASCPRGALILSPCMKTTNEHLTKHTSLLGARHAPFPFNWIVKVFALLTIESPGPFLLPVINYVST